MAGSLCGIDAGLNARTASKRSEATKSNQHLFLGQINEISSDFGGATSLSGTVDEKCDLRDPFRNG